MTQAITLRSPRKLFGEVRELPFGAEEETRVFTDDDIAAAAARATSPRFPDVVFDRSPELVVTAGSIEVEAEVLFGFLAAFETALALGESILPIATVKVTVKQDLLVLECDLGATRGLASIKPVAPLPGDQEVHAVVALEHILNVTRMMLTRFRRVYVGVTATGVAIGTMTVPFACEVDAFPPRAILHDADVKAAMPSVYLEDIIERVAFARRANLQQRHIRGVLVDIADRTFVATDNYRMHVLTLPNLPVESTRGRLRPLPIAVPESFFQYLRAVANKQWVCFEISEQQISSMHQDYWAMAHGLGTSLRNWRDVVPKVGGFWAIEREAMLNALIRARDYELNVTLELRSNAQLLTTEAGGRITFHGRRYGEAPESNFSVPGDYLYDAVSATRGGLVRIFPGGPGGSFIVRGDDNDFMAVISQ